MGTSLESKNGSGEPIRSVAGKGVPLRGDSDLNYVGGFYGQWEWQVTEPKYISVPFLQKLLREEAPEGWTEFSCHPGYVSDDFESVYLAEREIELRTLIDPAIDRSLDELGIELVSYDDYNNYNNRTAKWQTM